MHLNTYQIIWTKVSDFKPSLDSLWPWAAGGEAVRRDTRSVRIRTPMLNEQGVSDAFSGVHVVPRSAHAAWHSL